MATSHSVAIKYPSKWRNGKINDRKAELRGRKVIKGENFRLQILDCEDCGHNLKSAI